VTPEIREVWRVAAMRGACSCAKIGKFLRESYIIEHGIMTRHRDVEKRNVKRFKFCRAKRNIRRAWTQIGFSFVDLLVLSDKNSRNYVLYQGTPSEPVGDRQC
jgi:hypothetical protein